MEFTNIDNLNYYKDFFSKEKPNENHFILGIDIGSKTSAISYYDFTKKKPEVIDISGGYGKPFTPTVLQYIKDTEEWIFGEYAIVNQGNEDELTFTNLVEHLGQNISWDLEPKILQTHELLGIFIENLIDNVKSVNPKAEIIGIVVVTPDYFKDEAKEELYEAFSFAGYAKKIIEFTTNTNAVLNSYYHTHTNLDELKRVGENICVIDYANTKLSGGIYNCNLKDNTIIATNITYKDTELLGTKTLDSDLIDYFTQFYCNQTSQKEEDLDPLTIDQLRNFVHEHKDLLFQKDISAKPVKLYLNFAYPPLQKALTKEELDDLLKTHKENFTEYIKTLFSVDVLDLILTGGGSSMLWVRQLLDELLVDTNKTYYKNAAVIASEGGAIVGLNLLGLGQNDFDLVKIENPNTVDYDIGIITEFSGKKTFVPIIEKNNFGIDKKEGKVFILDEKEDCENITIEICKKENDNFMVLKECILENFPKRPPRCTKMLIEIGFDGYNNMAVLVKDLGFGEIYPKTDYMQLFT